MAAGERYGAATDWFQTLNVEVIWAAQPDSQNGTEIPACNAGHSNTFELFISLSYSVPKPFLSALLVPGGVAAPLADESRM